MKSALQGIAVFMLIQFAMSQFFGNKSASSNTSAPLAGSPVPAFDEKADGPVATYNPIPQVIAPIWPMNSTLDLSIYVSSSVAMPSLGSVKAETLILEEK